MRLPSEAHVCTTTNARSNSELPWCKRSPIFESHGARAAARWCIARKTTLSHTSRSCSYRSAPSHPTIPKQSHPTFQSVTLPSSPPLPRGSSTRQLEISPIGMLTRRDKRVRAPWPFLTWDCIGLTKLVSFLPFHFRLPNRSRRAFSIISSPHPNSIAQRRLQRMFPGFNSTLPRQYTLPRTPARSPPLAHRKPPGHGLCVLACSGGFQSQVAN
jgi:hypothetical protein